MDSRNDFNSICPVNGCGAAVDIALKSCDSKLIGAHQARLAQYSDAFPAVGFAVTEPVELSETAEVLHLMLHFMHNVRLPDLKNVDFKNLAGLAEAAEKYSIFSAMDLCKIHMELAVDQHPIEVFWYSSKHGYMDIADKAAKLTLKIPASEFLTRARDYNLQDSFIVKWYRFREQWVDILTKNILSEPRGAMLHKGGSSTCELWPPFHFEVIKSIAGNLENVEKAASIIKAEEELIEDCKYCKDKASRWYWSMAAATENTRPFSSF